MAVDGATVSFAVRAVTAAGTWLPISVVSWPVQVEGRALLVSIVVPDGDD